MEFTTRWMGELLVEMVKPGNPQLLHGETIGLPEGINRTQSHRYQRIASIPEEEFDGY